MIRMVFEMNASLLISISTLCVAMLTLGIAIHQLRRRVRATLEVSYISGQTNTKFITLSVKNMGPNDISLSSVNARPKRTKWWKKQTFWWVLLPSSNPILFSVKTGLPARVLVGECSMLFFDYNAQSTFRYSIAKIVVMDQLGRRIYCRKSDIRKLKALLDAEYITEPLQPL